MRLHPISKGYCSPVDPTLNLELNESIPRILHQESCCDYKYMYMIFFFCFTRQKILSTRHKIQAEFGANSMNNVAYGTFTLQRPFVYRTENSAFKRGNMILAILGFLYYIFSR